MGPAARTFRQVNRDDCGRLRRSHLRIWHLRHALRREQGGGIARLAALLLRGGGKRGGFFLPLVAERTIFRVTGHPFGDVFQTENRKCSREFFDQVFFAK